MYEEADKLGLIELEKYKEKMTDLLFRKPNKMYIITIKRYNK
jgi:hypothetical protein